jgi:hypothetical protein
MKSTNKISYVAILIGFICLISNFANAQISWPYPITNQLSCDIVVCYEFHDSQTCTFVCIPCPAGGVTIPAGATIFINGTLCNNGTSVQLPIMDVHVVIMLVDGQAPTPACTAVGDPNTCINSCGGTSISAISVPAPTNCRAVNINYFITGTIIN